MMGHAASSCILTLNGGSSSIKFALFAPGDPPERLLGGEIERIGQPNATLSATSVDGRAPERRPIEAADHGQAAERLIDWLRQRTDAMSIQGIGHRIVHGGVRIVGHQIVSEALIAELRRIRQVDPAHLPGEIALVEAVRRAFPELPQFACFDTVFHRDLPRVAQLLPIPRRYDRAGVRRLGFHGLSYTYLMDELRRIGAPGEVEGCVILAHLGAGASMAALRGGRPVDTTMAFTPTAGLVMATRPGDLDPGLLVYLMRAGALAPSEMDDFLNHQCGLLGVSETSPDMRDLLSRGESDPRAAEAVALFCYQARKWIGAFAAAMGGLDTLVFSAGIGERSSEVRAGICAGLGFLGLRLDEEHNAGSHSIISREESRVTVRIIPTDEESVIAKAVWALLATRGSTHA